MSSNDIVASPGRLFSKSVSLGLVMLLAACGGGSDATAPGGNGGNGGGGSVAVSSVAVTPATYTLLVGVSDSANLGTTSATATPKDASGNTLSGRTITWASSASTVAMVSASGVITAVSSGTANITATSEGQVGTAVITVTRPPVASLAIAPAPPALLAGVVDSANLSVATFTATPKDAAGHQLVGRTITWSSGSASVATVNATTGTVTALSAGTAAIIATSESQTGSVTVTVTRPAVATVTIAPASASLLVGVVDSTHLGMATFTVTEKDAAGRLLSGRVVAWASSASGVATVTSGGLVDAISPGSANVTATVEGVVATAPVTVTRPNVAQVVINPQTSSIKVNASETLTLTLFDAQNNQLTGAGRFAVASNGSPGIISVNGPTITGVSAGTGTATYTVDGVSASATITVTP